MIESPGMSQDAKDFRVTAALSYVLLLFIVPMGKKDSAFCQFHAKQGIALFVAWVVISFMAWIPFIGWAAWITLLVINVMAIVKTLNGESWELPVLGPYAKKIKL